MLMRLFFFLREVSITNLSMKYQPEYYLLKRCTFLKLLFLKKGLYKIKI